MTAMESQAFERLLSFSEIAGFKSNKKAPFVRALSEESGYVSASPDKLDVEEPRHLSWTQETCSVDNQSRVERDSTERASKEVWTEKDSTEMELLSEGFLAGKDSMWDAEYGGDSVCEQVEMSSVDDATVEEFAYEYLLNFNFRNFKHCDEMDYEFVSESNENLCVVVNNEFESDVSSTTSPAQPDALAEQLEENLYTGSTNNYFELINKNFEVTENSTTEKELRLEELQSRIDYFDVLNETLEREEQLLTISGSITAQSTKDNLPINVTNENNLSHLESRSENVTNRISSQENIRQSSHGSSQNLVTNLNDTSKRPSFNLTQPIKRCSPVEDSDQTKGRKNISSRLFGNGSEFSDESTKSKASTTSDESTRRSDSSEKSSEESKDSVSSTGSNDSDESRAKVPDSEPDVSEAVYVPSGE